MSPDQSTETATAIAAKTAPPLGVSLATIAGMQVSEIILILTLVYTILMIGHKIYTIYTHVQDRKNKHHRRGDVGDDHPHRRATDE